MIGDFVGSPIFILSPLPRSGTNYLWEILRRHPDCTPARSPLWEDYLLKNAEYLTRFADQAQESWDPSWGTTQPLRSQLLRSLGDGLIDFLSSDPERRVVTKSPTIANLDLFFKLFPHAHLLLLIRDGRDVAVSGMKTFGWGLREAATSWAWGAAEVERFAEQHLGEAVRVVRYEDLVQDPKVALREVLSFLHLPIDDYDLDALEEIPVRGSSTYFGAGRREINWEVLPRPRDFSPVGRWKSWSPSDITYFESIAGEQLARFGYRTASQQVG